MYVHLTKKTTFYDRNIWFCEITLSLSFAMIEYRCFHISMSSKEHRTQLHKLKIQLLIFRSRGNSSKRNLGLIYWGLTMYVSVTPSSFVQVMACRFFGAQQFRDSMLPNSQLETWEEITYEYAARRKQIYQQNALQNASPKYVIFFGPQCVNSSPPSAACMRRWAGSALVQIMACRLEDANPFSELMQTYYQLETKEQISMKFYLRFKYFHSANSVWTCRLRNSGHFVQGEIS